MSSQANRNADHVCRRRTPRSTAPSRTLKPTPTAAVRDGAHGMGQVADAVDGDRNRHGAEHEQKPRRQRRHDIVERRARMRRGANSTPASGCPEASTRRGSRGRQCRGQRPSRRTSAAGTSGRGEPVASVATIVPARHDQRSGKQPPRDAAVVTSASPPDQEHQAQDQGDHVGEIGVEAAGLQDLHARRPRAARVA